MDKIVGLYEFALITVEDAYDAFRQPDPRHKHAVIEAINDATLQLEDFCGRLILSRTHNWQVDGAGAAALSLPEFPITEITAASWLDGAVETPIPLPNIQIEYGGTVRLSEDVFPAGRMNIKISAVAGFKDGVHVRELMQARRFCKDLAGMHYQNWVTQRGGTDDVSVGMAASARFAVDIPDRIKNGLWRAGLVRVV